MKTKLFLLLAAVTLSGGAFASEPSARLTSPKNYSHRELAAFVPATHGRAGNCQTMLVTNNSLPKGMAQPTYVDCNSAVVRNSAECKRLCASR